MGRILAQLAHSPDNPGHLSPRQGSPGRMELLVAGSPALDTLHIPDALVDNPLFVAEGKDGQGFVAQVDRPALEMGDRAYKRAGRVAHPMNRQGAPP